MPSPILARADALMQRRRQNLDDPDDVPILTDAVDGDEDIPVLLDAEPSGHDLPNVTESPPETRQEETAKPGTLPAADGQIDATPRSANIELIAREVSRRIELQLQASLPGLIASTLADYLAEQAMLEEERNSQHN